MKIGRDKVVAEALLLLNEIGLDRLTTRALAARLGVAQPALCWHFKNRRDLLDAMNDAMMAKFIDAPLPPADMRWQDYLFAMGQRFRQGLLAYRDGARVHAGTPGNPQLLGAALWLGILSLAVTLSIGAYFVLTSPVWPALLLIGGLGCALILAYTPWLTRRPWLCLFAPGLAFGPLMLIGGQLALSGQTSPSAMPSTTSIVAK